MASVYMPGSGMQGVVERCASGDDVPLYSNSDVDNLTDRICYVNFRQWQLEDAIREPSLTPGSALRLIRQIQASNAERTSIIEMIDRFYEAVKQQRAGTDRHASEHNLLESHETLGQLLDILSILYVRKYHTEQLLGQGFEYHPNNKYWIVDAVSAIQEQIALCERAFCRLYDLYMSGHLTLPPLSHFKLYGTRVTRPAPDAS